MARTAPKLRPLAARFEAHVRKTEGCWEWTGALDHKGYGKVGAGGHRGETLIAHRVAWELATGAPVPEGFSVLHTCDYRACVRNDEAGTYEVGGLLRPRFGHLFLGTLADNGADMVGKGRSRNGRLTGEQNGSAKLTATQVREIRAAAAAGQITKRELARRYGVNETLIGKIVRTVIWRTV